MISSSNKMNKTIYLHVLFGLFASVIVSSYFDGFQKNLMQDSKGNPGENLIQLPSNVARSVQDNFFTLAIKFQHFFISRCLQFRYLPPLQSAPSTISMLFWVAFTRSISSMSDDTL
ncbi:hypothetical protein RGQ29_030376 [Quercus rubra]|uniref:Uncharacterized protein n=1 Tax=Quercus rubra TaxID=3512 RepID=A0AAN7IH39_QUERU|nr:hypothetical protein RGQ29_030376 [Quercus rubra]